MVIHKCLYDERHSFFPLSLRLPLKIQFVFLSANPANHVRALTGGHAQNLQICFPQEEFLKQNNVAARP